MYGLVNRAIEGLVRAEFGDDAWERIRSRAGVTETSFVAMSPYDDSVTYSLVGAASEELGVDAAAILTSFGEYWTTYTIEEGYGDLLAMMGSTLEEFLDNLDSMHARIGGQMPELLPPSFEREALDDGSSILHYRSEREGLAPMVIGLLEGMAKRFEVKLEIEQIDDAADGHARFLLRPVS